MFRGHNGLELTGDSLKISFRESEKWPQLTPGGTIRAYIFDIGDEASGPNIQLGNIQPMPDEKLDWRHSIDPLHHHGSDQFRVMLRGEWKLAGRAMPTATWSFQDSGMVYQEHPRGETLTSMLLLMGDRRGVLSTTAIKKDEDTKFRYGEIYDVLPDDKPYPHPAGDRGIAAIATSAGSARQGFVWGDFDDAPSCGLLGDAETGPIVFMLVGKPGEVVIPPCSTGTEMVLAVAEGSAQVGDETYLSAELRVQTADRSMPAVVAGSAGLKATLILGDRRAPIIVEQGKRPSWLSLPEQLSDNLIERVLP
jgi:hypothetical protein